MEELDEILTSRLWPGPTLATSGIWEANQQAEDLVPLGLLLYSPPSVSLPHLLIKI